MSEIPAHIIVGRVQGVFGVHGWVKVYSYTRPPDNIFDYPNWQLGRPGAGRAVAVAAHRRHGNKLLARLEGIDDRDQAAALINQEISVARALLPPLPPGEFYWQDLIGLQVVNQDGRLLGAVARMLETGANDVMVVAADGTDAELLIPYVAGVYVTRVQIDAGRIVVDWPE